VDRAYAELRGSIDKDSWEMLINGLEKITSIEQSSSK
jgi:hypothetical protein